MADTDLRREDQIDERVNDLFNRGTASELKEGEQSAYVSSGIAQLASFGNDPSNSTSSVKEQEESGLYRGKGEAKSLAVRAVR